MPTLHIERESVPQIIRATFPEYSGRKIKLVPSVNCPIQDLNWSGGSRSQYRACTLAGAPLGNLNAYNMAAPWNNGAEGNTLPVPVGACVVRHSICRGKDFGLTLYVNPADMAPMLPAPVELSPLEKTILRATAMYKASYGGRDRYDHARGDTRYSANHGFTFEAFPTRAQWDESKASLIARGFLNKAGAITNAGRNAIAGESRY